MVASFLLFRDRNAWRLKADAGAKRCETLRSPFNNSHVDGSFLVLRRYGAGSPETSQFLDDHFFSQRRISA